MPAEREATPIDVRVDEAGSDYLRAVMAETPTYWADDLPPPAAPAATHAAHPAPTARATYPTPTARAAHPTPAGRPITVWTPLGARQTSPEASESSWVIPAITIFLVLGIIAIIAAVIW